MAMLEIFKALAIMAQKQAVQLTDDQEALTVMCLYPEWKPDIAVHVGERYRHVDKLYKCRQAHTTQADWTPDAYPSGWEVIDEIHAGTKSDPIPYVTGMSLEMDKYYIQDEVLYLCIRDSGQPLYNNLVELIGNYVQVVK